MSLNAVSCCYCPRQATQEIVVRPTSGRLANTPLQVRVCDEHARSGPPAHSAAAADGRPRGPRHAAPKKPGRLLSKSFWTSSKGLHSS
jgi:hypothetical protein